MRVPGLVMLMHGRRGNTSSGRMRSPMNCHAQFGAGPQKGLKQRPDVDSV